jgi:Tfp pilus assembly protein FimT
MNLLSGKKHQIKSYLKGYTLVELLVVIGIIIIAALIAFPHLGNWIPRLKLSNTTRDVISDLRLARQYAVSQNRQFRVTFDVNNEQYKLMRGDASFGSTAWTQIEYTRDYTNPDEPSYSIDLYSATNDIIFNPDGSASSTLTVELRNSKGERYQVRIENPATGFVKSYYWNGTSWE